MQDFWKLGRIQKAHGVDGALVIEWATEAIQKMKFSEFIYLEIDGDPVPFFFNSQKEFGESTFLVTFEDVTNREKAKKLSGFSLYMKKDLLSEDNYMELEKSIINDLGLYAGYEIVDINTGKSYPVKSVQNYPFQKMACVLSDGEEKLIPITESFILSEDTLSKKLVMDLPTGLL